MTIDVTIRDISPSGDGTETHTTWAQAIEIESEMTDKQCNNSFDNLMCAVMVAADHMRRGTYEIWQRAIRGDALSPEDSERLNTMLPDRYRKGIM